MTLYSMVEFKRIVGIELVEHRLIVGHSALGILFNTVPATHMPSWMQRLRCPDARTEVLNTICQDVTKVSRGVRSCGMLTPWFQRSHLRTCSPTMVLQLEQFN